MMRRAGARAAVGAVLLAGACGGAPHDTTPVPSISAAPPPQVLAPRRQPAGLSLESLRASGSSGRVVVYAEPGPADPLTGRVLALTFQPSK